MCPKAVIMITAVCGWRVRSSRRTWMPSMSGSRRSTRARSGPTWSASSRPSLPVPAMCTSMFSWPSTRELATLRERIVAEARKFTNAEAGTLYLRDGDNLRFAVAQNDVLLERMGDRELRRQFTSEPLRLSQPSLAGYVALTGQAICLPDAYGVPKNRPYVFNQDFDLRLHYQTGSVLVVPLQDPSRDVI